MLEPNRVPPVWPVSSRRVAFDPERPLPPQPQLHRPRGNALRPARVPHLGTSGGADLGQRRHGGLKAQLAVEYAYPHVDDYQAVLWLPSEEPAALAAACADLARRLDLPEQDASDQNEAVKAVKDWLGRNGGWLRVFDNGPDAHSICDYLPQGATGHLLITFRDPN